MIRGLGSAWLVLFGLGLTGCGSSSASDSLVELSTKEVHLEAVFGQGGSEKQRLRAKTTGLRAELHGVENAPWLGLDIAVDGTDLGAVSYDFWATDSSLPKSHYDLDMRFDVWQQVDAVFERLVGSTSFRLTYDIRNAIAFQQGLYPFQAVQGGKSPQRQVTRLIGERGEWSVQASAPWLIVSPASGNGVQDITIGIDPTLLPADAGAQAATVTAVGSGSAKPAELAVSLSVESPRFLLPRQYIALTSDAGAATLPEAVAVLDTASSLIPFTVHPSESWLKVDGDTTTGGHLTIAAAAGQSPGLHPATIEIRADEAQLAGALAPPPAALNVMLYVSQDSLAPSATVQLPVTARQPIADPIRPYLYVIVDEHSLEAFDIETGTRVAATDFSSPLGDAVISLDGAMLYIVEPDRRQIHALALPELRETSALDVPGFFKPRLAWLPCAGRKLLWTFADELQVLDLDSGTSVTPPQMPILNEFGSPPDLFASPSGETMIAMETGVSPPSVYVCDIQCTPAAGEPIGMRLRPTGLSTSNLSRPVVFNADGSVVCFRGTCLDAQTMQPISNLSAAASAALTNHELSQLVFGQRNGLFVGDTDGKVVRFDSDWQRTVELQVMPPTTPGVLPPQYQLALTGDERRVMALNDRAVLNVWSVR
jgi:hypothetical protein